jgi:NAD-dependent SIR2 family protein deacetylase
MMVRSGTAEHLVDLVLDRSGGPANYALFIGAGASLNSGVKTADQMVEVWRNRLYKQEKPKIKYSDWLIKQKWYGSDEEYSELFSRLYDLAAQRRDCIGQMLEGSFPNWGYLYLASLLQARIFNTVFTTNFDDLINEACYLYTDGVRPIVCAHEAAALNIRITSSRPQIIKLHGDFLVDSILKNTGSETESLTENMQTKFAQFGQEYGLVVVGYGGRDTSIMSILENLLTDKQFFRHGIYWCLRSGDKPRKKVAELLKKDRVRRIDITGFDELMAMMRDKAGLSLPATVTNPMKVAEERSRIFCWGSKALAENPIIRKDIERVLDGLGKVTKKRGGKVVPAEELPLKLKVAIAKRNGDWDNALKYMKLEVGENKDDWECAFDYAEGLAKLGKTDVLKEFIPDSALDEVNKAYFLLFVGDDEAVIRQATYALGSDALESCIARINRAIAYKRLGRKGKMNTDLDEIEDEMKRETSIKFYMPALKAGVAALRKDKKGMLKALRGVLNKGYLSIEDVELYPVFEDYRNDTDFKSLISERKKGKN